MKNGVRVGMWVLMALLLGGAEQALEAQGRGGGGGRGGFGQPINQTELTIKAAIEHAEELEISEEQLVQLREMDEELTEIMEPINEEMQSLFESARSGGGAGGMREQMMELRSRAEELQEPFAEQLAELLTEDQIEQAEAKIPRGRGRGGR